MLRIHPTGLTALHAVMGNGKTIFDVIVPIFQAFQGKALSRKILISPLLSLSKKEASNPDSFVSDRGL